MREEKASGERGVALLFVILLTSVLLMVAIGITNIAYREAVFSSQAKDSDRAFFAADTGIECALSLDGQDLFGGAGTATPVCNGYMPALVDLTGLGSYVFALPLGAQCAEISVDKNYTAADGSGPYTQVSAVGYSVPADTAALPSACVTSTPNPRVVTRALRTRYLADGSGTTGTGTSGTTGGSYTSPVLSTVAASVLGPTSVKLTGSLDDMGGAPTVQVNFLYEDDATFSGTSYGSSTPLITRTATGPYSQVLTGLTCETTYDFQAWGTTTSVGFGSNMTFTTDTCP